MNCFPLHGENSLENNAPRQYEGGQSENNKTTMLQGSSFNTCGPPVVTEHNEIPREFSFNPSVIDNHSSLHAPYLTYPQANSVEMHALPQQAYMANGVPDRIMPPHTGIASRFQSSDVYDRQTRDFYTRPISPAGNLENHLEFRTLVPSQLSTGDVDKDGSDDMSTSPYESNDSERKRSERKKVPDNMKDGKYLERRQKNNLAAKKSRDQRKQREIDQQRRATELERENTVLRAQREALYNEAAALKKMIYAKKGQL